MIKQSLKKCLNGNGVLFKQEAMYEAVWYLQEPIVNLCDVCLTR